MVVRTAERPSLSLFGQSASGDGRQSAQSETYVVCLACERHFAYDWSTMRINQQRLGWAYKRSSGIKPEILHEQRP
jgi:hypothetical protein